MSGGEPEPPPAPGGTMGCPRCGAPVAPEQDWCLECGYPARTRVAKTPKWRIPLALAATVVVLALGALAFAFVDLTKDPEDPAATTPTQTAPPPQTIPGTTPPPATTPPPTTTPPAATVPPATTEPPTATVPNPGGTPAPDEP